MAETVASWMKHPGYYINEELEAREWSQRDLAFVVGCPEQAINMIVSGKRSITPEMAKALGEAFDIEPETFVNLQKAYDMAHARNPYEGVAQRRVMQDTYPVRAMIQRGWIQFADVAMLETQLVRFFEVKNTQEIPYMAHAAKKSNYEDREIPPAQLAWLFRVRQVAKSVTVSKYSERSLRDTVAEFEGLLHSPEEARHVPRMLAECGVRFVIVEKLPKADIDGVCFWLEGTSPVIGMSVQHDRIDNFWFVLRHEIEHVLQGHGKQQEMIDVNLDANQENISDEEIIANAAAADFCVPKEKLDSFIIRKRPFFYEKDVIAFSRVMNRHPGIVVGQLRKRLNRWDYLTRHLSRIRQFVTPGSIVDGWGQVVSVTL